jgi:hypothetical protein
MGLPKLGWLKMLKNIRSRLKRKPLRESDLPPQRQIDLPSAESAQDIASPISLPRRGRHDECRSIDSVSAGHFRICNQSGTPGTRTVLSMPGRRIAAMMTQTTPCSPGQVEAPSRIMTQGQPGGG